MRSWKTLVPHLSESANTAYRTCPLEYAHRRVRVLIYVDTIRISPQRGKAHHNIKELIMPNHRTMALRPIRSSRNKERKCAIEGRRWLEKQMQKKNVWTNFSYPLSRLQYCYNLKDDVFEKICSEYRSGKKATDTEAAMTPRNTTRIRQDILATILILGFNFSHKDFILAKRLATARNLGRSGPVAEERNKWPDRPDIFSLCPGVDPGAVSDGEIADFSSMISMPSLL